MRTWAASQLLSVLNLKLLHGAEINEEAQKEGDALLRTCRSLVNIFTENQSREL